MQKDVLNLPQLIIRGPDEVESTIYEEDCGAVDPDGAYTCTRPSHPDQHHAAHGLHGELCHRWDEGDSE